MSSIINHTIKLAGLECQLSAHSFRKFFQTRMESAGVNPDWIEKMVGRTLAGVRSSYSLPTIQDLFKEYEGAYGSLRVFDDNATQDEFQWHEEEIRGLSYLLEERVEKLLVEREMEIRELKSQIQGYEDKLQKRVNLSVRDRD